MKRRKKRVKFTKEEKNGLIILIIVMVLVVLILMWALKSSKNYSYEYALNNEIYSSEKCFYDNDAYCMKGNVIVKVDNYYEVK